MGNKQDFYSILGLKRDASPEEIHRAYLEAARTLHPDKNLSPGDTELFLGAQEAYETLSNTRNAPSTIQTFLLKLKTKVLKTNHTFQPAEPFTPG